jgi:hypothetical protein
LENGGNWTLLWWVFCSNLSQWKKFRGPLEWRLFANPPMEEFLKKTPLENGQNFEKDTS